MRLTLRVLHILLPVLLPAAATLGFAQPAPVEPPVRKVLQLPPGPDNPRNSECAFVTLRDGAILMVYSHFYGNSSSDYGNARLSSRISRDGGRTWSDRDKVEVPNEGGMNVMSVSLLRLQDGRIALFYARKNAHADCIPMVRYSTDEAETWSEARPCITDMPGYYVLNNDRVIQLRSGRLLMPVAMHQSPTMPWQDRGRIFCYRSDDGGLSWQRGPEVANPDSVVTQEPGVVELRDGHVLMFMRTNAGVQYLSRSPDGGLSWSPASRSSIVSPLSPASIKRLPDGRRLVMVWNRNDGSDPEIRGKRTPLTIAFSRNEGRTWKHVTTLESDKDGWYCYIALHFTPEGKLLAGYCAGSQRRKTRLAQTDIALIDTRRLLR
jgi:sialidase-1